MLVMHVDMDAFYASVEVREQPELKGRPVIVGGLGNRGVVASASYEARSFGARSAMPMTEARRRCPHATFVPPHFDLYHRYSAHLHEIFRSFSPVVEGIGLDEAFLDITRCGALFGPPRALADQLRERVSAELGLECSVGAGPSKLVAKLASEAAKPRAAKAGGPPVPGPGVVIVSEVDVIGFLWPLTVRELWGVGPASAERLARLGVNTVGELAAVPEEVLVAHLGKANGALLHALAWGRDKRQVESDRAPKSIGHEETYPQDITDRSDLERRLVLMADLVAGQVRRHGMAAKTVVVKFRYGDFSTLTRSRSFPSPQSTGPAFWRAGKALLDGLEIRGGARLLGLTASNLVEVATGPGEQLELRLGGGDTAQAATGERAATGAGEAEGLGGWERASSAIDAVRARFGDDAVRPGVAAGRLNRSGAKE